MNGPQTSTTRIDPQLTIAEVCEQWPAAAQVFLLHGMACVGCELSAFETLENAARVYRIPVAQLREEIEFKINA